LLLERGQPVRELEGTTREPIMGFVHLALETGHFARQQMSG